MNKRIFQTNLFRSRSSMRARTPCNRTCSCKSVYCSRMRGFPSTRSSSSSDTRIFSTWTFRRSSFLPNPVWFFPKTMHFFSSGFRLLIAETRKWALPTTNNYDIINAIFSLFAFNWICYLMKKKTICLILSTKLKLLKH